MYVENRRSGQETHETARQRLLDMEKQAELGGGQERIEQQHAAGKLTARERLRLMLDPGTFVELDKFKRHRCVEFGIQFKRYPCDGVVTGYGKIEDRPVFVFAQDFTFLGGSVGGAHAEKICKVMDLAIENGAPLIGLKDSSGGRLQEGVDSSDGYANIFLRNTLASGVIPQISVIMGPCAGGASYSPAITDFIMMIENTSHMFLTGPDVIREATHESVTMEELGGTRAHASKSGVCHLSAKNDREGIQLVRELLSFLPSNNMEAPPIVPPVTRLTGKKKH